MGRPTSAATLAAVAALAAAEWVDDAACAAEGVTADFFPVTTFGPGAVQVFRKLAAPAIAVCATCPVSAQCLAAAMAMPPGNDHGIWGGTTIHDRNKMRKAR